MSMSVNDIRKLISDFIGVYSQMDAAQQTKAEPLLDQLIERVTPLIQQLTQQQSPESAPADQLQSQVPEIARELWTLARGDSDIFGLYAGSYPDKRLQAIAANPAQLNALIGQINGSQQLPPVGNADGFQHASPQSSNVYGFRYDPMKKNLTVRFNEGSVYKYQGVPKQIFDMFANGEGVARTTGSNRWGRFWRGKTPSLGAALHQLIKLGGYPYQRVR